MVDKEADRRRTSSSLRRKYGLSHPQDNTSAVTATAAGYTDRADQRRLKCGSDNPYEKTQVASVHE